MMLELHNVSKSFGAFTALHPIHLQVGEGEFVALLGPSGCGKTTLLRIIAGFEKPTSGEVRIDGKAMSTPHLAVAPEKRNLNMVFQSFALWPHMTVRQHVAFPLQHHHHVPDEIRRNKEKRVRDMMRLVGLEAKADHYPHQLSGGQRQRVALARAIAPQPALLLMDEPLSNLDAELRMEMRREIQRIHRYTKTTILYVTHDQGEALAMADRIVVMKDGKIEQVGTPRDIYAKPETAFVAAFVGKANLVKGHWTAHGFKPDAATGTFLWQDEAIAPAFKESRRYPVRPEQFRILQSGDGIPGIITHVQYQGKEIHYTVKANEETYTVYEELGSPFQIDDRIVLQMKDQRCIVRQSAQYLATVPG